MKNTPSNHRLTIGFLARDIFDGYEGPIWRSVLQAAAEHDLNLISYSHENSILNLVDTNQLDGIITITGTINWDYNLSSLNEYAKRFSSVPAISIGRDIPGFSNLLIDNELGIRQTVEHLIQVHHCRRIAFIRGPHYSTEAQIRYKAYRDVLQEHGIPFDAELVCDGNFWSYDGVQAIHTLVNQRNATFDAVLASNDYMALAAMRELAKLGYAIPGDVAVSGFDDILEAKAEMPALTTVRQPLHEMGQKAVEMITRFMGGNPPETIILSTCPVFRSSCGCSTHYKGPKEISDVTNDSFVVTIPIPSFTQNVKNKVIQELRMIYPELQNKLGEQWVETLLEPLRKFDSSEKEAFLNILSDMISRGFDLGVNPTLWYSIIRSLEKTILSSIQQPRLEWVLNQIVKDAFEQIGVTVIEKKTVQQIRYERQLEIITYMFMVFNSKFESKQLRESYIKYFPDLNIRSYFLSRYEHDDKEQAEIINCFSLTHHIVLENEHLPFSAKNLVPGSFLRDGERFSYIVLPIMKVGFVVFELEAIEGFNIALHIGQIGLMVRMAGLMDMVLHYLNELEEKVENRTKKLKETQQRLLETAHQAGMAEIAVGVMHNVGNLLNSVGISSEIINGLVHDTKLDGFRKANVLLRMYQNDLTSFLANDLRAKALPTYYDLIVQSIERKQALLANETDELNKKVSLTREIVDILQNYARGTQDNLFEEKVDISTVIEDALKIQEGKIVKYMIRVTKDYHEVQPTILQKAKMTHIMVNIIKNAVEAMQSKPVGERNLKISLFLNQEDDVVIEFSDTGIGIRKEDLKKIFCYGFTTKKDGHGFGLHTCANYIGEMGGKILVDSCGPGQGAVFSLIVKKR
jgi:DNA-binding LacI/PurR family transcriptional regulator/signal transduction histidine kinase